MSDLEYSDTNHSNLSTTDSSSIENISKVANLRFKTFHSNKKKTESTNLKVKKTHESKCQNNVSINKDYLKQLKCDSSRKRKLTNSEKITAKHCKLQEIDDPEYKLSESVDSYSDSDSGYSQNDRDDFVTGFRLNKIYTDHVQLDFLR